MIKYANTYASWGGYSVHYEKLENVFSIKCQGKVNAVKVVGLDPFDECVCERGVTSDSAYLWGKYSYGTSPLEELKVEFIISDKGVELTLIGKDDCSFELSGDLSWGNDEVEDVYPMSLETSGEVLRTAIGPAASNRDNMLFDRLSDSALVLMGDKVRIQYDWDRKTYMWKAVMGKDPDERKLKIEVLNDLLSQQYCIEYAPLNKKSTFSKPPVGWMTWYAVKFDACEEKVLKNAKWMSENLKEYGAECVWVDWEWYHKDMTGARDDGADSFHPDVEKYPHGLKYVADKIKEMGLVPALWIGFTNDPAENEYIKENPEIILVDDPTWCGRYFFDFSHPKYLNEFLPKALECVPKWGYEAVKYDTLPIAMRKHEIYHENMYDPNLTTKEAYRNMIKKTRSVLGENCFMLSCAAVNDQDVLWAADLFDSARVGADIFKWDEFLKQGVDRTIRYYPLHNNVLYPDSDNVVLREEFNNILQAASRIYFVSMLGLPLTFGDEFDALDDQRIAFIKECLPILETHPMDIYRRTRTENILKMNLAINKTWECYNVVNVFNMESESGDAEILLNEDLGLDQKEYIVYDYTQDKLVGILDKSFHVMLEGCESKIFSVREKQNRPQIISTSRHISQGAAEIKDMQWNHDVCELIVDAELIENVNYTLTLYVPDDFAASSDLKCVEKNVYQKTVIPSISGMVNIKISFSNKTR